MNRHNVFSMAAVAVVVATAACNPFHKTSNEITVQDIPIGERWNASLATPSGLAGAVQIHGTGYVARDPSGSSKAVIHINNATVGGVHPWSVRAGLCGDSNNPVFGDLRLSHSTESESFFARCLDRCHYLVAKAAQPLFVTQQRQSVAIGVVIAMELP